VSLCSPAVTWFGSSRERVPGNDGWMNFTDQRVVVTGAASGIGAETAKVLAAGGAHVISIDRNPASGAHIAQHIACDLTDRASIDAAIAAVDGPIDALCNVAGVPGNLPSQTVIAVNFLGLRHLTEGLADQITDGGAIVNVASIAGNQWQTNLAEVKLLLATPSFEDGVAWTNDNSMTGTRSYNFSKEAVIVWTMAASQRWWSRGIRLNSVSPGVIETPILGDFRESMGDDSIDWAIKAIGRVGRPTDIAPAVAFLASRATPWINGTNLIVDGGLMGAVIGGAFG
jgi:NAD(P)-dependent dehydrogenase (short-subunit alcohol dehydrogenase family)